MKPAGITRRSLLGGLLLAAGSDGLAAGSRAAAPSTDVPRDADSQLLSQMLAVEQLSQVVLGRLLAGAQLSSPARRVAHRLLLQEHGHAAALMPHLLRLGAGRPQPPRTVADIDSALAARQVDHRLEDVHSERDALDLLLDLEGLAEGVYYRSLSRLLRPELAELAARILANEGQHESLLGILRHPRSFDRATPYAFVEGIQP